MASSAEQLQDLYFKLEKVEGFARWDLHEYELAKQMDEILTKIHERYMAVRGW